MDGAKLNATSGCLFNTILDGVEDAIKLIENSKKPLILAGEYAFLNYNI